MRTKGMLGRVLVLALAMLMLVSTIVGCGSNANNQASETSAKIGDTTVQKDETGTNEDNKFTAPDGTSFTMLYSDNASYQYRADWLILSEIKRLTNVDLKLIPVPESDYVAKRQIILNSGDAPDIISKTLPGDIGDYTLNGVLLPVSDYVDQMPNYKKFTETYNYKQDLDNIKEADGKYYVLPVRARTTRVNTHIWLARVDLYKKLGLELPKTMDDILTSGEALKKAYPNSTPITNRFGSANILSMIAPAFGTIAGWNLGNGFLYDEGKNEWIFAPTSDNYKQMLMYMNKLLNAGVLDKEFSTLDSNVYEQRVMNNSNFILGDWVGNEVRYNQNGTKNDAEFNVQPIFPPKGPSGEYALGWASMYEQGMIIPAKAKDKDNFDVLIKFLDWFYTDEAAIATSFGKEGVTFNYVNGKPVFIDDIKNGTVDRCKEYGIDNNSLTVREHEDLFGATKSEDIVKLYQDMDAAKCVKAPQPTIRLSAEEKAEAKLYTAALADYYNQMTEKFIFGKESFDKWDAFVAEANKKGADKLSKLYNDAWKKQTK